MPPSSSLPLLLSLFLVFLPRIQSQFHSFLVTKDVKSLHYMTKIYHGTPLVPTNVMIDLGSPFLWMDCVSGHASSSKRVIPSCSIDCTKATAHGFGTNKNSCTFGSKCSVATKNSLTRLIAEADIIEDTVAVQYFGGSKLSGQIITIDRFRYSCVPSAVFLNGLPTGVKGVIGLARSQISLQSQLSAKRFVTCFSSTNGIVLLGNDVNIVSIFGPEISRSLIYTPLVFTNSQEYFINVKSIKINGKRVSVNINQLGSSGSTQISTIVPYTTMESSIYSTFIKAYEKAAISMNMTRVVPPVAPFGICFASEGMKVPTLDLVLQSETVKWRIHGRNAMVHVSDEVMCLGVLDGGTDMKAPIVLGGFQLEDNVVDFDLGSSMLGFSSSLLTRQTSCSDFLSDSRLAQSI